MHKLGVFLDQASVAIIEDQIAANRIWIVAYDPNKQAQLQFTASSVRDEGMLAVFASPSDLRKDKKINVQFLDYKMTVIAAYIIFLSSQALMTVEGILAEVSMRHKFLLDNAVEKTYEDFKAAGGELNG